MAIFGLVHGAWHGAWCWDRLVPEVEARGHRAVVVELPASDPAAGLTRYAGVITEAFSDADDVVLVGHSLGGSAIPQLGVDAIELDGDHSPFLSHPAELADVLARVG